MCGWAIRATLAGTRGTGVIPGLGPGRLLGELLGQTSNTNPYVFLSDGGHFENLGLYEMVARRCRRIVVVDAGCDPDYAFEDLGNAIRRVRIDLGFRSISRTDSP